MRKKKKKNMHIHIRYLHDKNGTPASLATAFASNVFPQPGGPDRRTPLGNLAPIRINFSGFERKFTISINSFFAPSIPATSRKVM